MKLTPHQIGALRGLARGAEDEFHTAAEWDYSGNTLARLARLALVVIRWDGPVRKYRIADRGRALAALYTARHLENEDETDGL